MRIVDFSRDPQGVPRHVDVCIIGSGPAGMTAAAELAHAGLEVLVIESGGAAPDREELSRVSNVGTQRIDDQSLVRARALGGTSCVWSGRCVPLDDIDFEQRPWVEASGWPLSPTDLTEYYQRAAEHLQLGPQLYGDDVWQLLGLRAPQQPLDPSLLLPRFWHYSRSQTDPSKPTRFAHDVEGNFDVLIHATATRIESMGSRATAVHLSDNGGQSARVEAATIIVAGGAIETPRLLLASDLGNDNTGRYFMDHLGTTIASIPSSDEVVRERFGMYWKRAKPFRLAYVHGVALSPERQREEHLLNASAWLEEFPARNDPWQAGVRLLRRIGGRSAAVHIASVEFWRARGEHSEKAPTLWSDVGAVVGHPLLIMQGILRMLRHRPPLYKADRIDLYALVEQVPDRESRITLTDDTDVLGVPIPRIEWGVSDAEFRTTKRLLGIIAQEFERLGFPAPTPVPWMHGLDEWRSHVLDRAHQIGSTRMASDPAVGVVDANCRVFGTENLYVAGSSVFPTGGHANPTLTILALAIRLADHIAEVHAATALDARENEQLEA